VVAIKARDDGGGYGLSARLPTHQIGDIGAFKPDRWVSARDTDAETKNNTFATVSFREACGWWNAKNDGGSLQPGKLATLAPYVPCTWAECGSDTDFVRSRCVIGWD
jgi:hypothetical protein